jgi:hypothetical protein
MSFQKKSEVIIVSDFLAVAASRCPKGWFPTLAWATERDTRVPPHGQIELNMGLRQNSSRWMTLACMSMNE